MLLLLELSTTTSRREPRGKWTDNVAQATTVVVARRKYDTTRHPIRAGHQRPIPHSSSQAYRVSHKTFRLKNAIVIHSQLSCCMYLSWDHLISKWQVTAQSFYADIFKIFHLSSKCQQKGFIQAYRVSYKTRYDFDACCGCPRSLIYYSALSWLLRVSSSK